MSERNMNWKWCPFIKHTINSNWNHRTDKNELCHYLFKQVLYLMFVCPCIASISLKYNQQDATFSRSIYFYKLLHVFQAVPPPIIGSTKLCIQHQVLSNRYCCLLLSWMRWHCSSISSTIAAVSVWQYLTLYAQFCAPDDGRRNRLKHVEQFWADRLRLPQSSSVCGSTGTGRTPPTPFHIWLSFGDWLIGVVKGGGISAWSSLGGSKSWGRGLEARTPRKVVV